MYPALRGLPSESDDTMPRAYSLHGSRMLALTEDDTTGEGRLAIEPDRHTGLEPGRIALRIEAYAKRTAVVIADRPLRLPGCERPERHQLGDECRRWLARARAGGVD